MHHSQFCQVLQVCFSEAVADQNSGFASDNSRLLRSALRFLVSFLFLPLFQVRRWSSALLLFLNGSIPRLVCLLGIFLIGRLTGIVLWRFSAHLVLLGSAIQQKARRPVPTAGTLVFLPRMMASRTAPGRDAILRPPAWLVRRRAGAKCNKLGCK